MKKIYQFPILSLLLFIFQIGCLGVQQPDKPTQMVTVQQSPPQQTVTKESGDIQVCTRKDEIGNIFDVAGELLVFSEGIIQSGGKATFYQINGGNLDMQPIGLSPDNRWFSTIIKQVNEYDEESFRLNTVNVTYDESFIFDLDIETTDVQLEGLFFFGKWVSNQWLLVQGISTKTEYQSIVYKELINPFDNTIHTELLNELPGYAPIYETIGFSPSSSFVLYIAQSPRETGKQSELFLWDIGSEKILWRKNVISQSTYNSGLFDGLGTIAWSPDNSTVAFVGQSNSQENRFLESLFILDSTNIDNIQQFDIPNRNDSDVFIHGLSWSPNGKYLAFRVSLPDNQLASQTESLQIFDLESNSIIVTCPLEVELSKFSTSSFVWSSDNEMLAFLEKGSYESDRFVEPINILEIHTGNLFRLNIDGKLIGWIGN